MVTANLKPYGAGSKQASTLPTWGAGQISLLVFEPTLEEALGVLEGFSVGRRRVLKLDRGLLREKVRAANIRQLALRDPEVQRLLRALGLDS